MKVNVKKHTMMYPAPAVVASAYDENGNADACTLAFATMCSHHPPAVMIAINSTLKRKTLKVKWIILESNQDMMKTNYPKLASPIKRRNM